MADTPLSAISLSPRAKAALVEAGIETLEAAAARPDDELLALNGFAALSLDRLRRWEKGEEQPPSMGFQRKASDGRLFDLYSKLILTEESEEEALRKARVALAVFEEEASDG